MLRGQDVVVLLKLTLSNPADWTVRSLGEELGYDHAGVSRSIRRLAAAGLHDPARRRPPLAQVEEFTIHAVKYVFPAQLGRPTRGIPTAWAAPPLADEFADHDPTPPVWPHAHGATRGLAVRPLHRIAIEAAERDPRVRLALTLLDGIRLGDARVRSAAGDALVRLLREPVPRAA